MDKSKIWVWNTVEKEKLSIEISANLVLFHNQNSKLIPSRGIFNRGLLLE